MLEKMFTTKMSADKKKLQSRFSKIRSENGKTSKIIAIVLFTLIIVSIIAVSVYVAVNKLQDDISENSDVNALYELKGTYIGDAPNVRKIIDLVNCTKYQVHSIELKTNNQPFGLTVKFKVDSRANHRTTDQTALFKMSALIFSLVQNVDEISYIFFDDYSDTSNIETSFDSYYHTKDNMSDKVPSDYIIASTDNPQTFEEYYNTVMSMEDFVIALPESEFMDEVYEFIGDDYEIYTNSGIGAEFAIDSVNKNDFDMLSNYFTAALGKYTGVGIKMSVDTYHVYNFKTGENKRCAFMHYTHPDEGVIMVGSKWIDDAEFKTIEKFIVKIWREQQ